jgi:hypothetical protein
MKKIRSVKITQKYQRKNPIGDSVCIYRFFDSVLELFRIFLIMKLTTVPANGKFQELDILIMCSTPHLIWCLSF